MGWREQVNPLWPHHAQAGFEVTMVVRRQNWLTLIKLGNRLSATYPDTVVELSAPDISLEEFRL